ncbi:MAG: lipopolysaccharide heptosyltransferase II [Gammaproteobacteria bacterium]|nr:lipopolysaccharide heptosyltransferase II [Gammaproteobacteria bacterium]
MSVNTRRILVVGPAWVGDMVMSQSLIGVLQQQFQDAQIDMLAPGWSLPLVARMPGVHKGIAMPLGHGEFGWSVRKKLGVELRESHYHQAIVLPRSLKAALVPFHARIPLRTGYLGEHRFLLLNDIRRMDKQRLNTTQKRYSALGLPKNAALPAELPAPRLSIDADKARQLRTKWLPGANTIAAIVALMPGAEFGPAKQWPLAHFRELAKSLCEAGHQIVILGSEKERLLGDTIAVGLGQRARNLCGKTKLVDAVDLLSLAAAAVSNDSGLMHVAAAVNTPVVAIYGSSSPYFTPPLAANARVIYKGLGCSPCFKRTCPLGHTRCLYEILPVEVDEAVNSLLAESAKPGSA